MKDKIITFILITLIIGVLGVIGTLGYEVYKELSKEGRIEISFESETGFPTLEFIPKEENEGNFTLDENMFSGVDGTTQASSNDAITPKPSRYLYNQLSSTAKTIYNGLYNNKENLKTGTYKVEFGNHFHDLLSKENGDTKLKNEYQSAIEALVYENPDIFYLDVTKMYINIEKISKITGIRYNVYIDNGNEMSYLSNDFYSKEDIENFENQIQQVKNQIISNVEGKSNYEKIKVIHNYLIDTIEYDDTISQKHIWGFNK